MFKRNVWLWAGHTITFADSLERLHYLKPSGFWVGQQTRSTSAGHASSVRTSWVKLDPWGLFNAIISCLLACENADGPISAAQGRRVPLDLTDLWTALGAVHLFVYWMHVCVLFAGPHMCMHLGYCAKPSVVNPLICWTLEITAVICQLCQRGLEGACTSLCTCARAHTQTQTHADTHTHTLLFFNFTSQISV